VPGQKVKRQSRRNAGGTSADLDSARSDFFVSHAPVIEVKPIPTVRIEGAHPLRLAMLEAVLTDGGIVQAVMWAARPEIDGGPHGPWITPVSDQLTVALAGLRGVDEAHRVADRWRHAGAWEVGSKVRDELAVGLLLLAHLSRDAIRIEGRLWCWTELPDAGLRPQRRWRHRLSGRLRGGVVPERTS
jgi:hypothetical protein